MTLTEHYVKKLKDALAISAWHFKDAVEDMISDLTQEEHDDFFDIEN